MGQKYPCNFYILTVDGSYDQSAQALQALKMRPIIAGQAGIKDPTPKDCEDFRLGHPELGLQPDEDDRVAEMIVSEASSRLYANLFGQRSIREDWYNPPDRNAKNERPVEKEFRARHYIPPLDARLGLVGEPVVKSRDANRRVRIRDVKRKGECRERYGPRTTSLLT